MKRMATTVFLLTSFVFLQCGEESSICTAPTGQYTIKATFSHGDCGDDELRQQVLSGFPMHSYISDPRECGYAYDEDFFNLGNGCTFIVRAYAQVDQYGFHDSTMATEISCGADISCTDYYNICYEIH